MKHRQITIEQIDLARFWKHVNKSEGCWNWRGSFIGTMGYGQFKFNTGEAWSYRYAHRVSWVIHNGLIPEGRLVLHDCDNPKCVRPDHLFLGSHADNMTDAKIKGRTAKGERTNRNKLNAEQVSEIRTLQGTATHREIGILYGVKPSTIDQIMSGKHWKHLLNKPVNNPA